jgi:hypothetical protein
MAAPCSTWRITAYVARIAANAWPTSPRRHAASPLAKRATLAGELGVAMRIMIPMHARAGEQASRDAIDPGPGWTEKEVLRFESPCAYLNEIYKSIMRKGRKWLLH